MRIAALVAVFFFGSLRLYSQQRHSETNPGTPCGDRSKGVSDSYYDAFVRDIAPPNWAKSLIRISVGGERKLDLWTNGEKFILWTNVNPKSIGDFLNGLDQSCQLPPNPGEAVELMKIRWESKEISREQFAELHRTFIGALVQYTSHIQERYGGLIREHQTTIHLDAEGYSIVYDNSHEHIDLVAWNENDDHQLNPLITWVRELQKLAQDSFHRSFSYRPFGN